MAYQLSANALIVDEIDRLSLAYDKAKEYVGKISLGIDQQMNSWINRRQIIQMETSSSYDFLVPKTQRINELTLEAVEALCRVELLIEQIIRIDPKSINQARPPEINTGTFRPQYPTAASTKPVPSQFVPNGRIFDQPAATATAPRSQLQTPSSRSSTITTEEKMAFKPVPQSQGPTPSESPSRFTPIHRPTGQYPAAPRSTPSAMLNTQTSQFDRLSTPSIPPLMTEPTSFNNRPLSTAAPKLVQSKERIQLQRIPPDTVWRTARIDVIDSLSGFYANNSHPHVRDAFHQMLDELHNTYEQWERNNQLAPLQNIAIGDFGVAKYSGEGRWCRARLITCEGRDQIKLVFIDFGNIEVKFVDDFFPIDKRFTALPAQAIACSLSEAFPRSKNEEESIWPVETIQIFRKEVVDKDVEVRFIKREPGTEQWPLHFVQIIVNNQSITTLLNLKQCIDPQPNHYIAEILAPTLSEQEYILFNIPIGDDDFDQ